jgi:acetyl esterase/lipase
MDPRARRFIDMLSAGAGASEPASILARRAALQSLAVSADDASIEVGEIIDRRLPCGEDGVPVRIYAPKGAGPAPGPGLVFLHGGGWVAGGLDTHDGLCRRLVAHAGCRLIAVDYRLAPEHPFPAALEDGLAAVAWIAEHGASLGVDAKRLAIGGDSAGGALAAAICQARPAKIALQLLICPILDLASTSASRRDFAAGFFVDKRALELEMDAYCPPDADRRDPRLSPLRAENLSGLPKTLIHIAAFDPFRDEGEAYAARLAAAGVEARTIRHEGMIHYFYALARAIPYAKAMAAGVGEELRQAFAEA